MFVWVTVLGVFQLIGVTEQVLGWACFVKYSRNRSCHTVTTYWRGNLQRQTINQLFISSPEGCIKVQSACTVWNKRQKRSYKKTKATWASNRKLMKEKRQKRFKCWYDQLIPQSKYILTCIFPCTTGTNDSAFLLLPSHHRPISPAAPGELVWWLLSQEKWPGPLAPVYLSVSLPLAQSGRSPAGLVIPQRSKVGSRWRWCDEFSSFPAPLDFLTLKRGEGKVKTWHHRVVCWTIGDEVLKFLPSSIPLRIVSSTSSP